MLAAVDSDDQSQTHDRLRRLTLINSVIGISIAGISTRVFMISVPTLATALGTDMLGISWALIVYQMAGIGLGVVCGRLGDIYGHHKMYAYGMGVMAAGSLLCGLSQDVLQLILFRFVQGVGGAMIQSSGRTLAFQAMPKGSEGKAQGLMAMSHQFGFFVGPPLGGLIIDWLHWRGIFFLLFLPSLVGMALCFMTGRGVAPSAQPRQPIDYLGAVMFLGLTVFATVLLDQKIATALGGAGQALLALVFVGMVWGFISHEKKIASPMINLSLFSVGTFSYGSVGLLMCCITQGLVTFIAPFYLQDVLKLSPTFMGVIFLAPSLLSMVLSPVSGALTDRIGGRFLLILGVLTLMVAFLIGIKLQTDSHWIWPSILLSLIGIGSAFFNTPSQAVMIGSLPKEHWGTAIGIINGIFGLGHMLGISLSGIFLTLAFRYYSGIPGTTPNPGDAQLFVASMNVTYLFALGISVIPLLTSVRMKKPK
ncbi:MAG TPA: MFS transporter [Candidatus Binatia bacterium]|nr:MFS transporter [Candidatus Binatia bacterium]